MHLSLASAAPAVVVHALWTMMIPSVVHSARPQDGAVYDLSGAGGILYAATERLGGSDGAFLIAIQKPTGAVVWTRTRVAGAPLSVRSGVVVMRAREAGTDERVFTMFSDRGTMRWSTTVHPDVAFSDCDALVATDRYAFAAPVSHSNRRVPGRERAALLRITLSNGRCRRLYGYSAFDTDASLSREQGHISLLLSSTNSTLVRVSLNGKLSGIYPGGDRCWYLGSVGGLLLRISYRAAPSAAPDYAHSTLQAVVAANREVIWHLHLAPGDDPFLSVGHLFVDRHSPDEQSKRQAETLDELDPYTGRTVWQQRFDHALFTLDHTPTRRIAASERFVVIASANPGANWLWILDRASGHILAKTPLGPASSASLPTPSTACTAVMLDHEQVYVALMGGALQAFSIERTPRQHLTNSRSATQPDANSDTHPTIRRRRTT